MKCDMCKKIGTQYDFEDLLARYRTDDVQTVCSSCVSILNAEIDRLRKIERRWESMRLKDFMRGRREKNTNKKKWWHIFK